MPRTKSDYSAQVESWVSGKAKAPFQPRTPKRAKLIRKQGDITPFQKAPKGPAY